MKKELKGFVIGVAITSMILTALPIAAEKTTKTAELFYNDIKVVIDGKRADLKDVKGNNVDPFIIDGTTYLPVRAVANALDKAVSWDGDTRTVYIGKNEEIEQPSVWLKDLDTLAGNVATYSIDDIEFGGSVYNDILTSNAQDVYKNCWDKNNYYEPVSYLLNYKYSKFKGTIYLTNRDKDTSVAFRYLIYGDDKLLYTSEDITAGSMPIDFDIDVSNCSVMKISVQKKDGNNYSESYFSYAQIGNAGLYE